MKRLTKTRPWWQDAVIYEICPRSFADSNNDGTGDLKGITSKLDYLRFTLGVDAIWIRPFYRSRMVGLGYDITDHTGIAPVFGTMDDFDELLDQARRRDLRVMVDFVLDRTSDRHPWFRAARSSRHNPKHDWYIWADPLAPDGAPPSNWTNRSGRSCWKYHWDCDQYFLHYFNPRQPLVNWRNAELRRAMLAVLSFWLDKGVDGVHIDTVQAAAAEPAFRDTTSSGHIDAQYPGGDTFDTHAYLRMIGQILEEHAERTGRNVVAINHGEMTPQHQWGRLFCAWSGPYLPFNSVLARTPWTAASLTEGIEAAETALPAHAWPNHGLSPNGRSRLATRLGAHNARIAAMLLLTLRGTPTLHYGDELGLPDIRQDPCDRWDPLEHDRFRAPMAWTDAPGGGFSRKSTVRPWLPLTEPVQQYNVKAQVADRSSLLNLYRRLIALRRRTPALRIGDYEAVTGTPRHCLCFLRTAGPDTIFVGANLDDDARQIDLPRAGRVLLDTTGLPSVGTSITHLTLEPHSGAVIKLEQPS